MRHRYHTEALVLGRFPHGEASATLSLLTPEFGLVRARAQGVRKPGAKLAAALPTLSLADVILVRGKDVWRLSGATAVQNYAKALPPGPRARAGRVGRLALRLMRDESSDYAPFFILKSFFEALPALPDEHGEAAECLAALRLLASLGLDAGDIPGEGGAYDAPALAGVMNERLAHVARVNRGIEASGL